VRTPSLSAPPGVFSARPLFLWETRHEHNADFDGCRFCDSIRGFPVSLTLADNALIVARVKVSAADIKAGDYVATGGVPQPDGTQKAVELRIFPDSMRGNGDGHRPGWPGAPNGTMTNGAVGQTVSSVDGPVLTVKYRDGDVRARSQFSGNRKPVLGAVKGTRFLSD
jgi:hypothetical protein